ncbi:tyrosine-type recombinase/integrase [Polymorphobacter multimanifer]|uniref:Integrase n=1 Tax=Polymorphobacter multimanifer TaxID=1070431 RepID=A0A841KZV0_9SPHN|nr:integrase arm-type DNA-binding domain-containing protein [Polymorphobacter multimanifer]MBB6226089.1 integrase [Polymorphobacter multimanifer]
MALTDIQVKAAKPAAKPYKLADAKGLYLYVAPSRLRSWRMKYRFCGVEKTLTFGPYPEVRLSEAREKRDAARALLRDGRDPGLEKRLAAAAGAQDSENDFRTVAIAWHELHKAKWSSTHAADVIGSLERDVFPALGGLPIAKITPGMVLETLRAVEQRPAIETARRLRQRMSGVFVYAIACGFGQSDPAAIARSAMRPLPAKGRQPALVDLEDAKMLLAKAEAAAASPVTKIASRLLALTAVRSNVLRRAEWTEFEQLDGAAPVWRIPAGKMKLTAARKADIREEFVVPLSPDAVEAIEAVRKLTGRSKFLFPSARSFHNAMSENAIGYLYNRLGYQGRHVPHGWRTTFSTLMNERAEREERANDRAVIDLMLAHVPRNKIEGAYNRAAFAPRRRELAILWAQLLLEGSKPVAELLEGPRR